MKSIATIALTVLMLLLIGVGQYGPDATAQDGGSRTVAEKAQAKTPALLDFESRVTKHGAVFGPFNITIAPTNKGANGFRFIDVPYIQFIGN